MELDEVKRAQDVQLMLTRVYGAEEYRDTNEDEPNEQTQLEDTLNQMRPRRKKTPGATTRQ